MPESLEALKRIRLRILPNLEKTIPGFIKRLDWFFMLETGSDFITYFLANPVDAYDKLLEFFNGDRDSASFIIHVLLNEVLFRRMDLVDKAYDCLIRRDISCFREAINQVWGVKD